jgi:acyl-CoA reductase-like NAD-dependent aldehyde dehydrogenase
LKKDRSHDPPPSALCSPISQCPGEISGTLSRAKHLISIARSALADTPIPEEPEAEESKFKRFIRKEPVGVVVIVAPWK